MSAKRKPGRPAAGPAGEHVASMPKVRVPVATLALIKARALKLDVPAWKVLELAVEGV